VKRNPFGVETKTAASTGIGGLVTLVQDGLAKARRKDQAA
jgi:hypothetical protein